MKFYRIRSNGKDVGRFYLEDDGTGMLEIDGHYRPLEIAEKVTGEPWAYAGTVKVDATGSNREPHGN